MFIEINSTPYCVDNLTVESIELESNVSDIQEDSINVVLVVDFDFRQLCILLPVKFIDSSNLAIQLSEMDINYQSVFQSIVHISMNNSILNEDMFIDIKEIHDKVWYREKDIDIAGQKNIRTKIVVAMMTVSLAAIFYFNVLPFKTKKAALVAEAVFLEIPPSAVFVNSENFSDAFFVSKGNKIGEISYAIDPYALIKLNADIKMQEVVNSNFDTLISRSDNRKIDLIELMQLQHEVAQGKKESAELLLSDAKMHYNRLNNSKSTISTHDLQSAKIQVEIYSKNLDALLAELKVAEHKWQSAKEGIFLGPDPKDSLYDVALLKQEAVAKLDELRLGIKHSTINIDFYSPCDCFIYNKWFKDPKNTRLLKLIKSIDNKPVIYPVFSVDFTESSDLLHKNGSFDFGGKVVNFTVDEWVHTSGILLLGLPENLLYGGEVWKRGRILDTEVNNLIIGIQGSVSID